MPKPRASRMSTSRPIYRGVGRPAKPAEPAPERPKVDPAVVAAALAAEEAKERARREAALARPGQGNHRGNPWSGTKYAARTEGRCG